MLRTVNQFHSASENIALSHLKADLLKSLATAEEGKWMKDVIHTHGEYVENKELDWENLYTPEEWEYAMAHDEFDYDMLVDFEDEQDCYDLCFDKECNYIMFWDVKDMEEHGDEDVDISHLCEVAKFPDQLSHDDFKEWSAETKHYANGSWGFFEPAH